MATPSQDLICCKGCNQQAAPSKNYRLFCDKCAKAKQVEYQRQYRQRQKQSPRIVECKSCGNTFDSSKTGRTWRCPECILKYQREYAEKDKKRHAQYSRKYRANLGDEYRERMVKRRRDELEKMTPDEQAAFRKAEADKSARLNAILRKDVFSAYGGYKCACCGETEPLFLTIDHIENNGAEMRRNGTHSRGGTHFYQWLRKSGYPNGFQVLCMNCNLGKHRNGGVCPHKLSKV